ncbi:MAG: hypothetical protein BLM47_09780 [Candidatus Reconcilbacillus cellulovorans]|uniref:ABC transporter substrate-binding protein n=1 Tax=Candidatus Reconcilbacillus cellulovorans TaxID=1906605 RepID=A0A2A6DZJ9_9BACL|nr:MAG: hypothetical protein BLM47_09780 [Candidatus Reconcilbacillus cellulovorans]
MKRAWLLALGATLVASLAACGGKSANTGSSQPSPQNSSSPAAEASAQPQGEPVKLKLFTALPDRSAGMGKIEQSIIDAYMKEHPNVKIEVEALQDEAYKNKIKVYASTSSLPDIIQSWGQPSFIAPLIDNGLLEPLNPDDFKDYQFVSGSFDGFSKDGKLYGLPRNSDFFVLYYNKKIFADNGLTPPKTQSELLDVVKKLRAKNIQPVAINGMDGWSLPIWFEYVAQRASGDFNKMDEAMARKASFKDPVFLEAAKYMKSFADAKGFADGFLTADYGAARNLFGQEKAAMYMMGSWEVGLGTDPNFSESFRQNVSAMPYPASDDGKGTVQDVAAWYGGGYSVSAKSANKQAAIEFLKYFFKPENWAKQLWQSGNGFPAQKYDAFLTGKETEVQKQLTNIFSSMKSSSNTPVLDTSTPQFKDDIMKLHQKLLSGGLTPEQFVEQLDAAADKAAKSNGQ